MSVVNFLLVEVSIVMLGDRQSLIDEELFYTKEADFLARTLAVVVIRADDRVGQVTVGELIPLVKEGYKDFLSRYFSEVPINVVQNIAENVDGYSNTVKDYQVFRKQLRAKLKDLKLFEQWKGYCSRKKIQSYEYYTGESGERSLFYEYFYTSSQASSSQASSRQRPNGDSLVTDWKKDLHNLKFKEDQQTEEKLVSNDSVINDLILAIANYRSVKNFRQIKHNIIVKLNNRKFKFQCSEDEDFRKITLIFPSEDNLLLMSAYIDFSCCVQLNCIKFEDQQSKKRDEERKKQREEEIAEIRRAREHYEQLEKKAQLHIDQLKEVQEKLTLKKTELCKTKNNLAIELLTINSDNRSLTNDISRVGRENTELQSDISRLESEQQQKTTKISALRTEGEELKKSVEALESTDNQLNRDIYNLEFAVKIQQEDLSNLKSQNEQLKKEKETLERENQNLESRYEHEERQAKEKATKENNDKRRKENDKLNADHRRELENMSEQNNKQVEAMHRKQRELRTKNATLEQATRDQARDNDKYDLESQKMEEAITEVAKALGMGVECNSDDLLEQITAMRQAEVPNGKLSSVENENQRTPNRNWK